MDEPEEHREQHDAAAAAPQVLEQVGPPLDELS